MRFTLEQLKFADELAFPADMERLMKEHWPYESEEWKFYYVQWLRQHKCSLISFIFNYSRADLNVVVGNGVTFREYFERIIVSLIGNYGN